MEKLHAVRCRSRVMQGGVPLAGRPDPVGLLEQQEVTRGRTWCRCGTGA